VKKKKVMPRSNGKRKPGLRGHAQNRKGTEEKTGSNEPAETRTRRWFTDSKGQKKNMKGHLFGQQVQNAAGKENASHGLRDKKSEAWGGGLKNPARKKKMYSHRLCTNTASKEELSLRKRRDNEKKSWPRGNTAHKGKRTKSRTHSGLKIRRTRKKNQSEKLKSDVQKEVHKRKRWSEKKQFKGKWSLRSSWRGVWERN